MFNPIKGYADLIMVRGELLPGICRIVGLDRKAKIDEQMAQGQAGAYLIYRGRNLARWSIEVNLGFDLKVANSTDDGYDLWHEYWLAEVFKFPKGPVNPEQKLSAVSYDIISPALADAGISKFALESIKGPDVLEHGNLTKYTLACVEFIPRPHMQSGKIDAPQATPEDPNDKLVREAMSGFKDALAANGRAYQAPQ